MKKTIRLIMLVLAVCLVSPSIASADERQKREERRTPEEIAQMQARHIASKMKLDEENTTRFVDVYCSIEKSMREVEAKNVRITSEMTDEEVENAILARFERSRQILDIRRRGYAEYRKFLTPRQINKIYQLEKQTKKHLAERKDHHDKAGKDRPQKRKAPSQRPPHQPRPTSEN